MFNFGGGGTDHQCNPPTGNKAFLILLKDVVQSPTCFLAEKFLGQWKIARVMIFANLEACFFHVCQN